MSKTPYQNEVDTYICKKYNITLKELLTLDKVSLHQVRSDVLFEMMR